MALPPGLALAGIGARLRAWLIDSVIFAVFQVVFWIAAAAIGAVTITPDARTQMESSPLSLPASNPYQTNLPLLGGLMAIFVGLNVAYATVSWARFRGLPGQRLVSLQVGSAVTGSNLSLGRALVRSIVAVGIPIGAFGGFFIAVFAMIDAVPWSDLRDPQAGGPADAWSGILTLIILFAVAWPLMLLIWTAASATRQGLHDRLAGSLVVGKWTGGWVPRAPSLGYGPGYGGYPGYVPPGIVAPGLPPMPPISPRNPAASGAGPQEIWRDSVRDAGAPAVLHPATIGRRVAAYLFDSIIIFMIFLSVAGYAVANYLPAGQTVLDERTYILVGLAGGGAQLAYFVLGWGIWSGTLGQRLMHMRVGDATSGKALGWLDAIVRWATLQGPFALATIAPEAARSFVVAGAAVWAGYLLYATMNDPDRRGPHDRFLNSRVTLEP
jgi:uncharacterized RDD family membrane protein YckC